MNDVWIVGKGASLKNLKKEHFGDGLVITINSTIQKVESLGLPNTIYSFAKDGASPDYINECPFDCTACPYGNVYPKYSRLYLHAKESIQCMPDYPDRHIFDTEEMGISWRTESVLVIIEFALRLGFDNFHFLCFDAVTNGSLNCVWSDGSITENGNYLPQAERLKERVKTLKHEFIEP